MGNSYNVRKHTMQNKDIELLPIKKDIEKKFVNLPCKVIKDKNSDDAQYHYALFDKQIEFNPILNWKDSISNMTIYTLAQKYNA